MTNYSVRWSIDVLEDVLDSFWEHPLSFAHGVYSRYTEYMTDMFAGRIYGHERQPTPALHSFRKLLNHEGERERSYESSDLYSIPIGSRYHPSEPPFGRSIHQSKPQTNGWARVKHNWCGTHQTDNKHHQ